MVSVSQLQVAQLAQYSGSSRCPPVPTGLHRSPTVSTDTHQCIAHWYFFGARHPFCVFFMSL